MSYERWRSEGKINIDADSPIAPYLSYLSSNCQPSIYAYKTKRRTGSRSEFKVLIKKLEQFGGSDENYLMLDVNLRSHPPIELWHFTGADGSRIGSLESQLVTIAPGAMLRG